MAQFKTIDKTDLLKERVANSAKLGPVEQGTRFTGEKSGNFIKTRIPSVSPEEGFVKATACFKIEIPEPLTKEDFGNFCGLVTYEARVVGADRDYLMAVAYDRTKNMDAAVLGDNASPKAGPFQFTTEAWQKALDGPAKDAGLSLDDRLDWLRQPLIAAILAKDATDSFEKAFNRKPTFKELYFLEEVGANALTSLQNPDSIADALAGLQKRLEIAYASALEVIDQQPPWNRFMRASVGDPPWMAVAREQLARGVAEDPGGRNNVEITAYFQSVNAHVGTIVGQTVPWCGAFVGFCIKKCGVLTAADKVAPEAVGADYWLTWDPVPGEIPPVGAIVVFPGKHVGFLAEGSTDTTLQILGGNQSDRVSIAPFDRAGAQFRWFAGISRVPTPALPAGENAFATLAPRIMGKLKVDFPDLQKLHLAAILGNLGHECTGFTQMQEVAPIGGGPGGLGWAQWTGSRRIQFEASLHGRPPNDFDANYDFLRGELKGSHQAAIPALLATNDLHAAVVAFEDKFEKADARFKHYESRERYAQIALSLI